MSHDRGCLCGREFYEYRDCPESDCYKREKRVEAANDRQVGGSHYQSAMQHWDLISWYNIGYLEGCATKYVMRWKKKAGVQDIEKALHYIQKIMENHNLRGTPARSEVPMDVLDDFCRLNKLPLLEERIVRLLCRWKTYGELVDARTAAEALRSEAISYFAQRDH